MTASILAVLILGLPAIQDARPLVDDPLFPKQEQVFELLEVFDAWELTRGSPEVVVGVIDNGFDFFHPDLRNQLMPGFYASGGYHTEISVNVAHGTLVASLIAAEAGNGIGMAGFAPGCRILTASLGMIEHTLLRLQGELLEENPDAGMEDFAKLMAEHREEVEEFGRRWAEYQANSVADSIRYLVDHEVRVINLSGLLGKQLMPSTEVWENLQDAFAYAAEYDVLVVVGAGNNARLWEDYPGDASSVVVVGATQLDDSRWEMEMDMGGMSIKQGSNYGERLAVMAPAQNVVVCMPHEERFYESRDEFEDMYDVLEAGATSSATPVVTALIALIYSLRPELSSRAVLEILERGCDDIGDDGYDIYTGHGRVNYLASLELALDWEEE